MWPIHVSDYTANDQKLELRGRPWDGAISDSISRLF